MFTFTKKHYKYFFRVLIKNTFLMSLFPSSNKFKLNQINSRKNHHFDNETSTKYYYRGLTNSKNYTNISKIPKQQKIEQNGLPNLINTCFLNSILQSLFPLTQFTKLVQKLNSKSRFIYYLNNVFKSIKKMEQYQEKRKNMKNFIRQLHQIDLDYSGKTQEDAIDFLKRILKQLSYNSKSFMDFFNIIFTQECKNPLCKQAIKLKFDQIYIFYEDERCQCCHKPLNKTVLKNPKYLLVLGGDRGYNFQLLNAQNEKIFYKLNSVILYIGSGQFGHYVCYRKIFSINNKTKKQTFNQKQWKIYNDSQIENVESYYYEKYRSKYCIYQLVQQNTTLNSEQQMKKQKDEEKQLTINQNKLQLSNMLSEDIFQTIVRIQNKPIILRFWKNKKDEFKILKILNDGNKQKNYSYTIQMNWQNIGNEIKETINKCLKN